MMVDAADIERLKEIFVTRKECDERSEGTKAALQDVQVKLAIIEEHQKQTKWLTRTILGAVIATFVATLWTILMKGGA